MFSHAEKVTLLPLDDEPCSPRARPPSRVVRQRSWWMVTLLATLGCSLGANTLFVLQVVNPGQSSQAANSTIFAHLSASTSVPWLSYSEFGGEGEPASQRWENFNINNGSVAVSHVYAAAMGLPRAQDFPWDHSKGIYELNGYHSLHCLKKIHAWVYAVTQNGPAPADTHHVFHCLDALRQDVLCYADDTPRSTGLQQGGHSGTGQVRQCRDWSRLEIWAQQHTACYRYLHDKKPDIDRMEEFRFRPQDSPYTERVRNYFGE